MTYFKDQLKSWHHSLRGNNFTKHVYKIIVITAGVLVLLTGVALLVLPGPGIVVMGIGLLILSAELPWAGRLLKRGSVAVKRLIQRAKGLRRKG